MSNSQNAPLTADDIKKTRQHSTGRLVPAGCGNNGRWPERRVNWPDTMPSDYAPLAADACTEIGSEPDANGARLGLVVLLLSAVVAVGVISAAVIAAT